MVTIENTEIENTIIMEGTHIDCGRRIADSLIVKVKVLNNDGNLSRGRSLILGDQSTVTL